MLEITRKNCYKCDLERIIAGDSQYFWINLKDFEVETESNWQNIFNKYENSSTLKYRKELTPDIQFQPDRIFVRNDLFERIIKNCKATNVEFLMLKEKLGLCPYGVICDEQEFILPEIQDDIEELKKENKESMKIKISEESAEESIEIKSPKEDENATGWFDKNKFKKILAVVNSKKFNHKNKIGKLKYSDIVNLINNINDNTISETLAKKNLNALNEIKKAEIKNERLIPSQKQLLNFFRQFNIILTKDNNNNNSNNNSNNNNHSNNYENENENEIKQINNHFKIIDESKSFEDQIKLLKKNRLFR